MQKQPGKQKPRQHGENGTIMDVTKMDIKANKTRLRTTVFAIRTARSFSSRAILCCCTLMLRGLFSREGVKVALVWHPPHPQEPCATLVLYISLLESTWGKAGRIRVWDFFSPFQLKEKIRKLQLTSPLPDPGILNGFLVSSPLGRHWWLASLLKGNKTETFHFL